MFHLTFINCNNHLFILSRQQAEDVCSKFNLNGTTRGTCEGDYEHKFFCGGFPGYVKTDKTRIIMLAYVGKWYCVPYFNPIDLETCPYAAYSTSTTVRENIEGHWGVASWVACV
jgi:hypothetical protein